MFDRNRTNMYNFDIAVILAKVASIGFLEAPFVGVFFVKIRRLDLK